MLSTTTEEDTPPPQEDLTEIAKIEKLKNIIFQTEETNPLPHVVVEEVDSEEEEVLVEGGLEGILEDDLFVIDKKGDALVHVDTVDDVEEAGKDEAGKDDKRDNSENFKLTFFHDHKNICRNWNTWGCKDPHRNVTNRQHICLSCGSNDHTLLVSSSCNVIKGDAAALVRAHVAFCKNRYNDDHRDHHKDISSGPPPPESQDTALPSTTTTSLVAEKRYSFKPVPEGFENNVTFEGDPAILATLPPASKLQILNLPLSYPIHEKTELAAIFSQYGEIYDISFTPLPKVYHGFIQFATPDILAAAIKGEDRREMSLGFKLDLVDEHKRSMEKANMSSKTVDQKPHPSRTSSHTPTNNCSRKREASPIGNKNKRGRDTSRSTSRTRDPQFRPSPIYRPVDTSAALSGRVHDVQLIGLEDVQDSFIEHVESRCTNANLRWKTTFLSYRDDISAAALKFHAMGVAGVLFVERKGERDRTLAVQVFPLNSQSKEFVKMSVSEAIVCIGNEKRSREASNPANQLSQFLSLAAQANVPVDQNLLLSVAAANANPYAQPYQYAPAYPQSNQQQFQGQYQQSYPAAAASQLQGQYNPGNYAYTQHQQPPQFQQMSQQQQPPPQSNGISGILNAFSQNQSLLNNLNLLKKQ